MYKNNDDTIDWIARHLLSAGIYKDPKEAYSQAIKHINDLKERVRKKQEKEYFQYRVN